MSTPNRMQTYWPDVMAYILTQWPKLSPSVLENISGDFDKFLVHLKEIYNDFPYQEAVARQKIQAFINQIEEEQKI